MEWVSNKVRDEGRGRGEKSRTETKMLRFYSREKLVFVIELFWILCTICYLQQRLYDENKVILSMDYWIDKDCTIFEQIGECMRTMLLSFKPEWYNRIKDGSKIFEYRRTFPDEEIMAYMYVSSPMKMIVGKVHLGRKIDLNTWKEQYKEDIEVCERIDDYLTRHSYAMPVLSFQMTREIELETLRKFDSNFVCPQMYYYLENYPELFEFIKKNAIELGKIQINSFENIAKEDICRKQY